jgi:hypothetical protein
MVGNTLGVKMVWVMGKFEGRNGAGAEGLRGWGLRGGWRWGGNRVDGEAGATELAAAVLAEPHHREPRTKQEERPKWCGDVVSRHGAIGRRGEGVVPPYQLKAEGVFQEGPAAGEAYQGVDERITDGFSVCGEDQLSPAIRLLILRREFGRDLCFHEAKRNTSELCGDVETPTVKATVATCEGPSDPRTGPHILGSGDGNGNGAGEDNGYSSQNCQEVAAPYQQPQGDGQRQGKWNDRPGGRKYNILVHWMAPLLASSEVRVISFSSVYQRSHASQEIVFCATILKRSNR